jgi:cysteine synthase
MKYFSGIAGTIGSTPLVQLNRLGAGLPAHILAKL